MEKLASKVIDFIAKIIKLINKIVKKYYIFISSISIWNVYSRFKHRIPILQNLNKKK